MRMWRNWQTRQAQDLVEVKFHGGSSPLIRTVCKDLGRGLEVLFSLPEHDRGQIGDRVAIRWMYTARASTVPLGQASQLRDR